MALMGAGAVAIWHDIASEAREAFYDWHGREHMAERVAIPGFLRGRRYVAIDAGLEYFNLYEATSLDVLRGPDYQDRLNNPTPWTTETIKHFQNVARSLCTVAVTLGPGQGGLAATLRYDVPGEDTEAHRDSLPRQILDPLSALPQIAGAHLLQADIAASEVDTAERKLRSQPNRVPRWVVVVEGWGDEAEFLAICREHLSQGALAGHGAEGPMDLDFYRLQVTTTP